MALTYIPVFSMAVLACWLGLSLLVRAPHERLTRLFAWLCFNLTLYGLTAVLPQLTGAPGVALALQRLHTAESVLLTPIFLHFIAVLVGDRPYHTWQRMILVLLYVGSSALAVYAISAPQMLLVERGGWPTLRFPDGPLVVLWGALRVIPLALGLLLLLDGYRRTRDFLERRQRALIGAAALIGVVGALWIIVGRELALLLTPGHILMTFALVIFAYTVLTYRSLLPERVAQRAFYRSLLGGLLTAGYIGALLVIEPAVAAWLQIDLPLITIVTLTALIAVFGPLRDWAGEWIDRRFFHREFDYGRLLRAVSDDLLERGDLADQLQAALVSICRTLDLLGGFVAVREGPGLRALAHYGAPPPPEASLQITIPVAPEDVRAWEPWPAAQLILPLRRGNETFGLLVLREKRSGEPIGELERGLLDSLCAYLALAIRHAHRQQEEELALAALAEQSRQLQAEHEQLTAQALASVQDIAPTKVTNALHVFALGPLRVERQGRPIERWGGDKAGTYQAEALFAFLFDRRGRGVTKDEAAEVIWPDLSIEKADMAFHRTISALRRTLEPGLRRASESHAVTFHHERYWLDPELIDWCDTDEFAATVAQAHTAQRQGDLEAARTGFTQALLLCRGEYLDDCPFFGDSSYVEERRSELRDSRIDALLTLGAIYEQSLQSGEAATCYRRAITAAGGECQRAEERLLRLQQT